MTVTITTRASKGTGLSYAEGDQNLIDLAAAVNKITADTVIATADLTAADQHAIIANAAGGAMVVTLPSAGAAKDIEYIIKKIDATANTVTVDGANAETIDGMTTVVLTGQWEVVRMISDGVGWVRTAAQLPSILTDHALLTNIGTNTHAEIDTHIADATTHFTEGSIDHANITGVGTNSHAQIDAHVGSSANPHSVTKAQVGLTNVEDIKVNLVATTDPTVTDDSGGGYGVSSRWFNVTLDKEFVCLDASVGAAVWAETTSPGVIDHTSLTNIGTNSHAQIDTHIADASTHFTEGSIDHTNITNVGSNSHAQIDTHITNNPLNKLDGTVAPTINDDSGSGYSVGSKWIDEVADIAYIAVDVSVGAAIWDTINVGEVSYTTTAIDLDGTSDWLDRTSDLTGNADSKLGIFSAWVKIDTDGVNRYLYAAVSGGPAYRINFSTTNRFNIIFDGGTVNIDSNIITSGPDWVHILASWDVAVGALHLYIDDISSVNSSSSINTLIGYTSTQHSIFATNSGDFKFNGCCADYYFNMGEYLDFSVESNRRKFIDANGKPVDLGSTGSAPTGTSPIIFLKGDNVDFEDNLGTGGAFTAFGTLVDCIDAPSRSLLEDHSIDTTIHSSIDVANEWNKQQNFNATTLADGANISWNLDDAQVCSVTLAGNRTLDNPTNMKDGATYIIRVVQDGTGSRTLAYGTAYKWSGGVAPTLTTGIGAIDILTFISDGTNMYGVEQLDFS